MSERLVLLAVVVGFLLGVSPALGDTLADIRARGELVVGVKADYPPWGMRDEEGRLQGMEIDLARDLAARIGVAVRLKAVQTANRMEMLRKGQVDVVIATMGDSIGRRAIVGLVQPHYYASGVSLLAERGTAIADWSDLAGQPVCAKQGSYFNIPIARRYGFDLLLFKASREAKFALRDGRCVGFLFDDTGIAADLRSAEWQGYDMVLPSLDRVGWSIGLRHSAMKTDFGAFVSRTLVDWHRSGFLLKREAAWGLPPSDFLRRMHELWTAGPVGTSHHCAIGTDGTVPERCEPLNSGTSIVAPARAPGPVEHFLERHGINLGVLFDPYQRGRFVAGIGWTVVLSILCVAVSVAAGLGGAAAMRSNIGLLRWASASLIAFFRHTPPLVQLYFFFFGIGALVPAIGGFAWAVLTLGLYAGASNAVIFGAGIGSVPRQTVDAARALGYGSMETQARIVLPLALRSCLPTVNANLVNIVKATGLAGAIAVPELLNTTNSIWPQEGNTTEMMNLLLVIFFILISALVFATHRLERAICGREETA